MKLSKKIIKSVFLFLFGAVILSSCEKVIDPDLKDSDPVFVIEGGITNINEIQTVRVSKTIKFDQANGFNGVKGAKVVVTSSTGQVLTFPETTDGIYRSPRFRGVPGVTYKLQVTASTGEVFTASSTMPAVVRVDSINFKKITIFSDTRVYPSVYYTDPAKVQNQYRYIMRINNKQVVEHVSDDRFNDGNASSDLINFDGDGLQLGDKAEIEMQCIDRNVFKYYYAISQIDGEGGPPVAPSNPDSNISNGALGIFSAYTRAVYVVTYK